MSKLKLSFLKISLFTSELMEKRANDIKGESKQANDRKNENKKADNKKRETKKGEIKDY